MSLSIPEYNKIKFKYLEDYKELNNEIVNKLNDKCVIGIFRGKMEFGPRALEIDLLLPLLALKI